MVNIEKKKSCSFTYAQYAIHMTMAGFKDIRRDIP